MTDKTIDMNEDKNVLELYHRLSKNEQELNDILTIYDGDTKIEDLDLQLVEKLEWEPTQDGTFNFDIKGNEYTVQVESEILEIDFFEENTISEYNVTRGSFNVDDSITYKGEYSLSCNTDNRSDIYSNSGLPNYPYPGDTFGVWLRQEDVSNISFGFGGNGPRDWNIATFYVENDSISLGYVDDGITTTLQSKTVSLSYNTWYHYIIEWGENGKNMKLIVKDESDNTLVKLEDTDDTHNNGGIIGFETWGNGSGKYRYMDYMGIY